MQNTLKICLTVLALDQAEFFFLSRISTGIYLSFKHFPLLGGAKTDLKKDSLRVILGFTKETQKIETGCSTPDKNLNLHVCLQDNYKGLKAPTY